jgi:hypothetical protein
MTATNESKELTREERVAIATRIYGLYMMPQFLFDAKLNNSSSALTDIDCAMDNAGVPYYRDLLKESEKKVLEEEQRMQEQVAASKRKVKIDKTYEVIVPIGEGRLASLYLVAQRNDRVWAVGLDKDGEIVLVEAFDNASERTGYALKEVHRVVPGQSINDAIGKFLSVSWLFDEDLSKRIGFCLARLKTEYVSEPLITYALPDIMGVPK